MNKVLYFSLILFLLFSACDAPRENPFDPNASNAVTTTIQLFHLLPSSTVVSGAEIFIPEINQLKRSDQTGTAVFIHPNMDSITVISRGEAFFPDTTVFNNLSKTNTFQIRLNTKPQISETQLTSFYENIENHNNLTSLSIRTQIIDPDGLNDIETVIIRQEKLDFTDTLEIENASELRFAKSFSLAQISPSLTPGEVTELNFELSVKNKNTESIPSGPLNIVRVIKENLLILSPESGSAQTDTVKFSWQKMTLDYDFTYNLVLQRLGGETHTYNLIPASQNILQVSNLMAGTYFFSLQVQDRPGNICQSPFSSFTYQP